MTLKDKNGIELPDDCIIYGHLPGKAEMHYFRTGFQDNKMFACTWGYSDMTQEILSNMELIGSYKDHAHLME